MCINDIHILENKKVIKKTDRQLSLIIDKTVQ